MCCISNEISAHAQSSEGHTGFRSEDLPSLLMAIFFKGNNMFYTFVLCKMIMMRFVCELQGK